MIKKGKNKNFLFWIFVIFLILPLVSRAQNVSVLGKDILLREYLFPISSYMESGNLISKLGAECEQFKAYNDADYSDCANLTQTGNIRKLADNKNVLATENAKFSYKLTVKQQGNYVFKINVANDLDNFSKLTRQQIDYILTDTGADLESLLAYLGEGISTNDLSLISTRDVQKYQLYRSMVFSVYVDGEAEADKKGFIFVKNTDPSQKQEGVIKVGNLIPGDHVFYLHYLSDYYYDFGGKVLPDFLNNFKNADLNKDSKLDTNPIIYAAGINSMTPTDDVIGIRIYTNNEHKDIMSWYQENVINASADVESITIDGYKAVRDERTVYVNAANLKETPTATGTVKQFFTNIYVMAYNQAAPPSTANIFNQMLNNWKFNTNIESAEIKDKLRRDMTRLVDLNTIDDLIKSYYAAHGKYPTLEAGTFVKEHTISTWPSWQATLGNQLGSGLPVDPLNIMTADNRKTYDCNSEDPLERANCVNICTRDKQYKPLTGCPLDQQCIHDEYCSICPVPYDSETCWDQINSKFAYTTYANCEDDAKLNGAFNLGGTKCEDQIVKPEVYDGAYVYQYTSLDNGKSYRLNYRLEYTEKEVCSPNQCYFDNGDDDPANDCYNPGGCLASCNDASGNGVIEDSECSFPQYKNTYCYLGNWRKSCGDGFIQQQCGEICDPNVALPEGQSWCDLQYGQQDWYNEENIKPACTAECKLEGLSYTPLPYSPQTEVISCGGFCSDQVTQAKYGERCDEGSAPAPLKRLEEGGLGGISETSQYMCSGKVGGKPIIFDGIACSGYASWDATAYSSCPPDSIWVSKLSETNTLVALGGFKVSYNFNLEKSGSYAFKITTANYGDDLTQLTTDQINYLFELKKSGQPDLYNLIDDGGLTIPEYGEIPTIEPQKYSLLRSLIYSVYLDGENEQNRKGFIIAPATNQDKRQAGTISLGVLNPGSHTIYLHFVGDNFYLPFAGLTLPDYINNFSNTDSNGDTTLDINPLIFSTEIFSPELNVGSCKTYGGWCGDSMVQLDFGEQCDIKGYVAPTPIETVNIVKNSGFEKIFSPWEIVDGKANLDDTAAFAGRYSVEVNSRTSTLVWLKQFNNFFANKPYRISMRIKPIGGLLKAASFQTGDQTKGEVWTDADKIFFPAPKLIDQKGGWDLYQTDFTPTQNGFKFRIVFITAADTDFNIDEVKITPLDTAVRPQYQCGNDYVTKKVCQFKGGYCGDGRVQSAFGETCDDRVGLSCASGEGCGPTGSCVAGICQSDNCNDICKSTYCGDGLIQPTNSLGTHEICDYGSDPYCAIDCQHIKMGGTCDSTKPCVINASCSIRNFGDTKTLCLGARGSLGCRSNNDCILGYYCDKISTKCEPEISTYLRYHPESETTLTLPEPPYTTDIKYNISNTKCPSFNFITTSEGTILILDSCTGLLWNSADSINKPNWTFKEAEEIGCGEANRLPSITELYSLVKQTNTGLYADKEALRLCPLKCAYDQNKTNLCSDCADDNYLYWSSTCVDRDPSGVCYKALAVNFKYGSIEEYDAGMGFKVHCLKETKCGNGSLEQGEACEFYQGFTCEGGQNAGQSCQTDADCPGSTCLTKLIEQTIKKKCTEFGYDAGFLHCDPATCTFRLENCLYFSRANKTCQEICQGQKTLACKAVGLNTDLASDYYNIPNQEFIIADDSKMMGIDAGGNCVVQNIPGSSQTDYCNYRFVDRESNCYDTATGQIAPFRSEYSYCNCEEK